MLPAGGAIAQVFKVLFYNLAKLQLNKEMCSCPIFALIDKMIKPAFGYKMHLMKHTMSELELFFSWAESVCILMLGM
jgi:hypothetical protein